MKARELLPVVVTVAGLGALALPTVQAWVAVALVVAGLAAVIAPRPEPAPTVIHNTSADPRVDQLVMEVARLSFAVGMTEQRYREGQETWQ
jgi:hypothetical protein